MFEWHHVQGVAVLEDLVSTGDRTVAMVWPANVLALFGEKLMPGHVMVAAARHVSVPEIKQVLSAIRTKLLEFAIELERLAPNAGEAAIGVPVLPPETVTQVVNMTIFGGTNTIAAAGRDAQTA